MNNPAVVCELLPCPFCGSAPETSRRPESTHNGGGHVAFIACYCGGYASTAHQMGSGETVQAAVADVVAKWNRRAKPAEADGVEIYGVALDYMAAFGSDEPRVVPAAYANRIDDPKCEKIPLVRQSDHLAALAKRDEEIDNLRRSYGLLRTQLAARPALAEPNLFACVGKGGEYERLGYAKPAGTIKVIQGDSGLIVYRDTASGVLYFRDPKDFQSRMEPIAARPA